MPFQPDDFAAGGRFLGALPSGASLSEPNHYNDERMMRRGESDYQRPDRRTLLSPSQSHLSPQLIRGNSLSSQGSERLLRSSPGLPDQAAVKIAVICALPLEANAVIACFDGHLDDTGASGRTPGDPNAYTRGVIAGHPVVVAHMPGPGKVNASNLVANVEKSFRNIELALLVGICGGVPCSSFNAMDVRLGDVVISQSIVQYDYGRKYHDKFERKTSAENSLLRAPLEIRSVLAKLETEYHRTRLQDETRALLNGLQVGRTNLAYPGVQADRLFQPSYLHKHRAVACTVCHSRAGSRVCHAARSSTCTQLGCQDSMLVSRPPSRSPTSRESCPSIHIGVMGSGDWVMKSGKHRDKIARKNGIVAFEMEAAGLLDRFPFLVFKGVADYADSHKNDVWHIYAATAAACCAKAFLKTRPLDYNPTDATSWSLLRPFSPAFGSHDGQYPALGLAQSQSAFWYVPVPRKPNFPGRSREIAELEQRFATPGTVRVSLLGLAGVGKSNLALEFAYHVRERSPDVSVFWIQASDALNFENCYADLVRQLQIPLVGDLQTDTRLLVKQHLSQQSFGRWLLILDNVDDFGLFFGDGKSPRAKALNDFVPTSPLGCTLITTHYRKVAIGFSQANILEIACLDDASALDLLQKSLLGPMTELDTALAPSCVDRLACLPLAIVQASAYINLAQIHVSDYMELLDGSEETVFELLNEDFFDEGRVNKSVISAWGLTFDAIFRQSTLASECLALIASIDAKNIPQSFLPQGASQKQAIDAVLLLTGYSLITRQEAGPDAGTTFDMHRLVHLACRSWLHDSSKLALWTLKALEQLLETFPAVEEANRAAWASYLPHASRLLQSDLIVHSERRFDLMCRVAECLFLEGKYRDAAQNLRLVVKHREQTANLADLSLFRLYADFAAALERDDRCDDAEKYNQKALDGYIQILDIDDPIILGVRANMASVKRRRQLWKDAEQLDKDVLEARIRVLGSNHPDTFSSLASLGSTYRSIGLHKKAEELHQHVVEGLRAVVGEADSAYHSAQASLASTYRNLGRLNDAEQLELEVMERRKDTLGPYHPATLRSMANLASTYRQQKRWSDAEDLEIKVFRLRSNILGKDHPETMTAVVNLASTYRAQGKYNEAEVLDQRVLNINEQTHGRQHPSTLSSKVNLASTYRKSQRHSKADDLYLEVMKTRQRVLGEGHYQTQWSMIEGAHIFRRRGTQGSLKTAHSLASRVLKERERTLGRDHKLTQDTRRLLATVLRQQKRWPDLRKIQAAMRESDRRGAGNGRE